MEGLEAEGNWGRREVGVRTVEATTTLSPHVQRALHTLVRGRDGWLLRAECGLTTSSKAKSRTKLWALISVELEQCK